MLEGRTLGERYQVKQLIGGGGMANVYLGFDRILDREVAIKVLKLEYANDDEFITRFHREAQNATSLSHPNIVNIYDVDDENDIYYMVMEYIEGMTLKKYIQLHGPVPTQDAVYFMEQMADAITHAHHNHIVHRDIKPQNILVNNHKEIKVTDFGIALALSATSMTQTNAVLGSVHYLSPEQARGGIATKKSDIYSLGIVLFELLTGRLPFSGESAVSIALKHLQQDLPSIRQWVSDVPQSLENVVLKATTKDPTHRYASVEAFRKDLSSALNVERANEMPFYPPVEAGEETKAIPIVSEATAFGEKEGDTIVHQKTQTGQMNTIVPGQTQPETEKGSKKKKMTKKKKVLIWTMSIFTVLLFSLLFALFVLPAMLQPDDIELNDLIGQTQTEAETWLTEQGLVAEINEQFSEEIDADLVISQEPVAGRLVKEGSTVTLFVSTGEEPEPFGDYVGRSYSQVERLLLNRGYQDVQRIDSYSDEPIGTIIAHESPLADEPVRPGETVVVFEVSAGERMVTLDDLAGMDEFSARDYLTDQNLVAKVSETYSSEIEEGDVISQSPEAGTEVAEDSVVELVISLGEEEQPPLTHEVTVTVPYTLDELESTEDPDEPEPETIPQEVRLFIDDRDHALTDLYETEMIVEDTTFTIRMVIEPDQIATYRVERDDEVLVQKTVAYEDIEGD